MSIWRYEHAMSCSYPEGCTCGATGINESLRDSELDGINRAIACVRAMHPGNWRRPELHQETIRALEDLKK